MGTFRSPISKETLTEFSYSTANVLADWNRGAHVMTIDGKTIKSLLQEEEKGKTQFTDNEDLKKFMEKHLLKNLDPSIKKEEAMQYLLRAAHQGALLSPVSGALSFTIGALNQGITTVSDTMQRGTAIVTTKEGLIIQEKVEAETLVYAENPEKPIKPDAGHTSVLEAQATFKIDFKHISQIKVKKGIPLYIPTITVESNTVSYGNEKIRKLLDKRKFAERLWDAVKQLLGYHKVESLVESRPTRKP